MEQKISHLTASFYEHFKDFIVRPDLDAIYAEFPEDRSRAVIQQELLVIPAREKFSDWDIFCYTNTEKITIPVLNAMRTFILNWHDFDLVEDYVTMNPIHTAQPTYQSLGSEKLLCVQLMGMFKQEQYAPLIDFHIYGIENALLQEFYTPICTPESTTYLNWSMITLWRKFRRTGVLDTTQSLSVKSIYPALSRNEQEEFNLDPILFFSHYFKGKFEYKNITHFLEQ